MPKKNPELQWYKDKVVELEDLIEIATGDAHQDPYFHGMANGMIFAFSMFKNVEPDYIEAPPYFQHDLTLLEKLEDRGIVLRDDEIGQKRDC